MANAKSSVYPGLKNKTILVTGAGSGIGAATALYFASQSCRYVTFLKHDFEFADFRLSLVGRKVPPLEAVKEKCLSAGAVEVSFMHFYLLGMYNL